MSITDKLLHYKIALRVGLPHGAMPRPRATRSPTPASASRGSWAPRATPTWSGTPVGGARRRDPLVADRPVTTSDPGEIVRIHHSDRDMLTLGDDRVKAAVGPGDGSRAAVRALRARRPRPERPPGGRAEQAGPLVPRRHAVGGVVREVARRLAGGDGGQGGTIWVVSDPEPRNDLNPERHLAIHSKEETP